MQPLEHRVRAATQFAASIHLRRIERKAQCIAAIEQQFECVGVERSDVATHRVQQRLQGVRHALDCDVTHRAGHALDRVRAAKQRGYVRCHITRRELAAAILLECEQRRIDVGEMFATFRAEQFRVA